MVEGRSSYFMCRFEGGPHYVMQWKEQAHGKLCIGTLTCTSPPHPPLLINDWSVIKPVVFSVQLVSTLLQKWWRIHLKYKLMPATIKELQGIVAGLSKVVKGLGLVGWFRRCNFHVPNLTEQVRLWSDTGVTSDSRHTMCQV